MTIRRARLRPLDLDYAVWDGTSAAAANLQALAPDRWRGRDGDVVTVLTDDEGERPLRFGWVLAVSSRGTHVLSPSAWKELAEEVP